MAEDKASPRRIEAAEKRRRALELKKAGKTYDYIAKAIGYADKVVAYRAVAQALRDIPKAARDEYVALELEQYDMMTDAVYEVLRTFHYVVSDGRIVYIGDKDDPNRIPLADDAPVLNAVDRLLKISQRRCRLLGLDAPTRVETITLDSVDAEIRKLERELASNEPARVHD